MPIGRAIFGSILILFASFSFIARSQAEVKPSFKPGMWEFHQVSHGSGGRTVDLKKCTDPWKDMQAANAKMKKRGCEISPTTQSGNVYHFSATCPMPDGTKGTSTTDLTYESDSAYTAKIASSPELVEMTGSSKLEITAKRTGDCP